MSREQRIYRTLRGTVPFEEWLENLRDVVGRAKAKIRIKRAIQGNFGDHRFVGAGIVELRIHYEPGYRIYIGMQGPEILVLLCGGDKNTQEQDINNAREYWEDYVKRL